MIELPENAIERLRAFPDDEQDVAARLILSLLSEDPSSTRLGSEQAAEVKHRLAHRAELVSHAEERARFRH